MKIYFLIIWLLCLSNQLISQSFIDSLKIVDYHVHIFSEELLENLEEQGYSFEKGGFQILFDQKSDYGDIKKIIQTNSNAKMLLISGGYAYKDLRTNDSKKEVEALQRENNLLSDLVKSYPDRLIGFYGVDPLKEYSLKEVKRCQDELKLHGIKLHLQGEKVDLKKPDHINRLKKLLEIASKEQIPLLIHNNAGDLESGKEYGKLFKETLLKEIGPLTIIFAHAGGGGGYFNYTRDFLNEMSEYFQDDETSKRHKIYFELSGTIQSINYTGKRPMEELKKIIGEIGVDKFLFGTDFPFRNSERYIKELSTELKMDEGTLKQIIERDIFEELKR